MSHELYGFRHENIIRQLIGITLITFIKSTNNAMHDLTQCKLTGHPVYYCFLLYLTSTYHIMGPNRTKSPCAMFFQLTIIGEQIVQSWHYVYRHLLCDERYHPDKVLFIFFRISLASQFILFTYYAIKSQYAWPLLFF